MEEEIPMLTLISAMLNWAVFYDKLDIVKYLVEKEKHNVNKYCNNSYSSAPKPESATPLQRSIKAKC